MPARRPASTIAFTFAPSRSTAADQVPDVDDQLAVLLRVGDFELDAVADELARVADLAAALAVERRAIEHDPHRIFVADLVHLVAEVVVRRRAGDDALHRRVGLGRRIAEKLGRMQSLLERVDRALRAHHGVLHLARYFAVLLHRGVVALPIECQVVLRRQRFEQLGRHAIRLVQLGRHGPVDRHAIVASHLGEDAVDVVEPRVDRAEEVRLFLLDHAADPLHRFAEFRIGPLHHLGDFRHELVTGTARACPSGGHRAPPAATAA